MKKRTSTRKKVFVLYAPGTNCEEETMEAVYLAGGDPVLLFLDQIYRKKVKITDCDVFLVPGGFSFGDHIEAGVVVATLLEDHLPLLPETGIPTLGICNGKQILVRAGLFGNGVTMTQNRSGVFCSHPVRHQVLESNCVWTRGLEGEVLTFPAAHRYGRLVAETNSNPVMTYGDFSPNGGEIAMICNNTGRIAVLMDHPERPPYNEDGLKIFRSGIRAV